MQSHSTCVVSSAARYGNVTYDTFSPDERTFIKSAWQLLLLRLTKTILSFP